MESFRLTNLLKNGSYFWQLTACCSIILLLLLTLTPGSIKTFNVPHIDKLYHYVSFFGVTFLVNLGFVKIEPWLKIIVLIGLGFTIEVIQHFIPNREFSWLDLIADASGVLSMQTIFMYFKK